jgi:hypothetical protein
VDAIILEKFRTAAVPTSDKVEQAGWHFEC